MADRTTPMITYLRWQKQQPRLGQRTFVQTDQGHPMAGHACPDCGHTLADGRPVRLWVLGPEDQEDQETHQRGGWYSAVAVAVHDACTNGDLLADEPDTVDEVVAVLDRLGMRPQLPNT